MGELIIVDKQACIQCGNCVEVCPSDVVQMEDEGYPTEVHEMCIACGHCAAVCPTRALDNALVPLAQMEEVDPALAIGEAQARQFIRSRRSVRCYQDKPVAKEDLERLFDLVRYAPSGTNAQGVSWMVIQQPDKLQKIADVCVDFIEEMGQQDSNFGRGMAQLTDLLRMRGERQGVLRNAPCLLVCLCNKKPNPAKRKNTAVAQATLELYAPTLGLASCWAGFLELAIDGGSPGLLEALAPPEGKTPIGAMLLGYPVYTYRRMPGRKPPEVYWED